MFRRLHLHFLSASLAGSAFVHADAIQSAPMAPGSIEQPPKQPIAGLEITPPAIALSGNRDYAQVLVTARLANGDTADVTRFAKFSAEGAAVQTTPTGIIAPKADGKGKLIIEAGGQRAEVPLTVGQSGQAPPVDFIQDVNPVLTRLGCNQGTCHGAKDGKYGFKLSLRGYDPLFDVRSLKDDLAARRLNVASPDDSLMLLKATAGVPHEGGQRTKLGDKYYDILRAWIADGAQLNLQAPRVTSLEVFPKNPVVQEVGANQQFRVVAKFADGTQRDVTQEAFVESGNGDVAALAPDANGLVKTLRRGEAPVLARYEGNYAATTLMVMGDRTGFTWQAPETWSRIDELVAEKWRRLRIEPSGLCSDADFLRRVYLDLAGLPPTPEEVRAFLSDATPTRQKRDAVVDRLIGAPEFVEHWTNKWCDLLQVNSKFLGGQGVTLFRDWIKKEVAANTPYDQFVRKVLTARGSNKDNPAASYWKILREPTEAMENTTHLFLATRFNCNKCHDHPFERWTQDQYYHLSAYFAQVNYADDPASGGARIGGSAVEKAHALFEIVNDKTEGEMTHLRTNKVAEPQFPYPAQAEVSGARREQLAAWMVSGDNRYFASSYVNRLWGYLLGVGLIEPLDDIRAGNPASNPELLEYLRAELVNSKFDVRHVLRLICKSRTYQLSVSTNRWNEDDKINYSHALARRLPAEVLYDSVLKVTGAGSRLPGGVRAGMLADAQADLPSGFLANTGRPVRESSCECERSSELRLGSIMALLSGAAVAEAIGDPANVLAKVVSAQPDNRQLADELFVRVLNRPATPQEVDKVLAHWNEIDEQHAALRAALEAKEKEQAPAIAQAEAVRAAAIAAARAELTRYEAEIVPKLAAAEAKRKADVAAAEAGIKDYEAKQLTPAQERFEQSAPIARTYTGWQPLEIVEARATGGIELIKQPDGSFQAQGSKPKATDYVVKADTKLAGITGLMLEVMLAPEEVNFGPGRATGDGNFVLGEFSLKAGETGTGANPVEAKFTQAIADFNQLNFDVKKAIDGKKNDGNNGWAVSGATGQSHLAAFTLEKPLGHAEKGVRLRFEMHQPREGGFAIARFRLWATTGTGTAYPGYPVAVTEALKKPTGRSEAEQKALAAYWRENDPDLVRRRLTLAKLQLPPPIDDGVLQRRAAIVTAEMPIKVDPRLVQLRADVAQSEGQLANKRLTGAQDLVWALVNNPAFLFNH